MQTNGHHLLGIGYGLVAAGFYTGLTLINKIIRGLEIGAASGVFSVPFAERGARVTAVETSPPLIELLEENIFFNRLMFQYVNLAV